MILVSGEAVEFDIRYARLGSRTLALLIDIAVQIALTLGLYLLLFWITWRDLAVVTRLAYRDPELGSVAAGIRVIFLLYGFYYTMSQGIQRALAADYAHPVRRATELGAFHTLVGLAAFPASVIAGLLFTYVAPSAPFFYGAALAAAAAILLKRSIPEPAAAAGQ